MVSEEAAACAAAVRRRHNKRPVGYHNASIFGRVTYSFMDPFLRLGARGQIQEDTAAEWLPPSDTAQYLAARFSEVYTAVKVGGSVGLVWPLQHVKALPAAAWRAGE